MYTSPVTVGNVTIPNRIWLAPMAGVSDLPFRLLCRRQGAGSLLYRELEGRLRDQGIVNLLAGVGYCEEEDEYLSHDSYKYHLKEGYTLVAQMKGVGKKFDRWYDLLWLQKKL